MQRFSGARFSGAHLSGAIAAGLLFAGCGAGVADAPDPSGVSVAASFYPLAFVAERVGDGRVEVTNITPPGVEPHDLELSPSQARALADADLVVYLGGRFQPALEDAVDGSERALDLLEEEDALRDGDPHVWLDPTRLATMASRVAERMIELDPDGSENYEENLAALRKRLTQLDVTTTAALSVCERRAFVTSHDAFGYLADRYDLQQIPVSGLDPEAEPSPQRIAEVAQLVRDTDVTTIFFEQLLSPGIAQTIAAETGARTDVLDPLESPPTNRGYFAAMRANVDALVTALEC